MKKSRKAVFLDRDGVINQAVIRNGKPYPPESINELVIMEGVLSALNDLKAAEYLLIGITNQPDVARGTTSRAIVESINLFLMKNLPLNDIFVCYHDDADHCDCRKPAPGLLLKASNQHGIDLKNSFMVGDRWKDIEAGKQAGCKTIWIDAGYSEACPKSTPNYVCSSLREGANWILSR